MNAEFAAAYFPYGGDADGKLSPANFMNYYGAFAPGYGYMQNVGSGLIPNVDSITDANATGVFKPIASEPLLSPQSSVILPTVSTPASVQSSTADTGTTKSQRSTPSVSKKKASKKQATKASSVVPNQVKSPSNLSSQHDGKKSTPSSKNTDKKSKPQTSQKATQAVPMQSTQPKKSSPPSASKKNSKVPGNSESKAKDAKTVAVASEIIKTPKDSAPSGNISTATGPNLSQANANERSNTTPVPSKKKSKKKKKKAASKAVSSEDKENVPDASTKVDPKNIIKEVLKDQKLHVNILFLLSQMQSKSFQNVQDMLIYLQKQSDFRVNDCWVECC